MERSKQLEYCKKCTKRRFEITKGITCSLTGEIAEFNEECADFSIDQSLIMKEYEKSQQTRKHWLAYGFAPKQIEDIKDQTDFPLSKKEEISGFFSLLRPREGYFVTPLIVMLNIAVFLIMVLSGVHLIMPTSDSLLLWGANFRPLTMAGEWWRLLTSTFIHIGVLHLLFNMYALVYIGLLLEPYLGRVRFLSAYILSGIAGSVASLFWHEMTISAGASGAIFGMYGVFVALLTTRIIEKSARKSLLISIGLFVVYNLINGMKEGIDNAAHIGGLISGLVIGYSYYPGLVKPSRMLKTGTIVLLTLIIVTGSMVAIDNTNDDISKYEMDLQQFVRLEAKALRVFDLPETASDQEIIYEIQHNGLDNWRKCIDLLHNADAYALPDLLRQRNRKLIEYCELRIESYKIISRAISEGTDEYNSDIIYYNGKIESILSELSPSAK